jgi:hypothetical protein
MIMAPLVPDIIGNELNLIVALLIGIAFGFILEQAGFSTSRKLVGLFYGYDFTVLRVFFTAGVTAMIGIIALGHFGLLDISLVYINPTFIWSALVGGLIMGLGFVIGGFCPGTSFCAAAIGKIDAIIFIIGSFLGVLIFAESYPFFEGFYKSGFWGYPRIFEILGISQSLFAFLLTFAAVMAFVFTTLVENRVNGQKNPDLQPARLYLGIALLALLIGFSAFIMPDRQTEIISQSSNMDVMNAFNAEKMTIDEFAFRIIDGDKNLRIIDLRSPEQFKEMSFPNSVNFTFEDLFGKDASKILSIKNMKYVMIADDEESEKKAAFISFELGYDDIKILSGGLKSFNEDILNFRKPESINTSLEADKYKFREKASRVIPQIIQVNKNKGVQQKKETKRVLGGC